MLRFVLVLLHLLQDNNQEVQMLFALLFLLLLSLCRLCPNQVLPMSYLAQDIVFSSKGGCSTYCAQLHTVKKWGKNQQESKGEGFNNLLRVRVSIRWLVFLLGESRVDVVLWCCCVSVFPPGVLCTIQCMSSLTCSESTILKNTCQTHFCTMHRWKSWDMQFLCAANNH